MNERNRKFFSFICVGGTAMFAYIYLASLLATYNMENWMASSVCYLSIIPFAYYAQRRITFRSNNSVKSSFTKYTATQLLGLLLSFTMPFLMKNSEFSPILIFTFVAVVTALFNFVLLKIWAFKVHN